jgi:predicted acyl esterase
MANRWAGLSFHVRKVVVGLLVVLACCALHAQSAESYGIVESRDVMIPMRDGVKLAADIYRPARDGQAVEGKFPCC